MTLDPETYAKAGTEHAHQVALFMWAAMPEVRKQFPDLRLMFAIPNGGERNKIVAGRLKAEGVKSGVPDIFLPVARHNVHGLFIEMKRPKSDTKTKGKVQGEQSDYALEFLRQGYGVAIAYGFPAAKEILICYLS